MMLHLKGLQTTGEHCKDLLKLSPLYW